MKRKTQHLPRKLEKANNIAVIDIGSNSVRLVIYRIMRGRHIVIHEKKATCQLAQGMTHDRAVLNRQGIARTLKTLRKFGKSLRKKKIRRVLAIGTAAMRAAIHTRQGKTFHRDAQKALGFKIKIISGVKEARLTAFGVMSALPMASGVCGDLGGGSLELASIFHGRVRHTVTLPLGSLTLASESNGDPLRAEELMHMRLSHVKWLGHMHGRTFYPIGGSWRAVGRVMMKKGRSPTEPVHGFTIAADKAYRFAEAMARQKPAKFRKMHKKIRHRADVIPYAAAVLAEIIIRMRPGRIIFSGRGVREGLVREAIG